MKKKALIIGINDYQAATGLKGCVNDTTNLRVLMRELLGFKNEEVRILIDRRATKTEIERGLSWLVSGARPGDLRILHFSGHGSQISDRGERDELVDQLDEILCPWDVDFQDNVITDDYLQQRLQVPRGVVLEAILDCCNSGDDATQSATTNDAQGEDRRPRFAPPPRGLPADPRVRHNPRRLFRSHAPGRLALWSACAATQTAADARIDGVFNGAFTFYLCKHLREAEGRIPRSELLRLTRASLLEAGYEQVPELAAPVDLAAARAFHL